MTFVGTGELDRLEADLGKAPARAIAAVNTTTVVAANKIKTTARDLISGYRHLPAYPYSITYDIKWSPFGVEAEIGPDKGLAQGPLGNIIEFGTRNNAPIRHLGPALDREAPAWTKHLGDVAGKSVLG